MSPRVRPITHSDIRGERAARLLTPLRLALLAIALVSTLALTLHYLTGLTFPGCRGEQSACDRAAASVWGRVPLLEWPVALPALAFFTAMFVAAAFERRDVLSRLRPFVRFGAAASAFYLVVSAVGAYWCPYCLTTHGANLAFWGICERTTFRRPRARGWSPAFLTTFFVVCVVLGGWRQATLRGVERERQESVERIAEASLQHAAATRPSTRPDLAPSLAPQPPAQTQAAAAPTSSPPAVPATASSPVLPPPAPTSSTAPAAVSQPAAAPGRAPFTGRFRLGPPVAALRIVVFSDYQCPDCGRAEGEIRRFMSQHTDISLTIKHFPFCADCNSNVGESIHPNACWAARAAEAAGIFRGDDGFFVMHAWLFDHGGAFTDAELNHYLESQGYDVTEFSRVMQGPATLKRVQADIAEAITLGLYFTPMIFVNGVELRGWQVPGAVTRSLESLAAQNLPALGPERDAPPSAAEKYVGDWREQPRKRLPPDATVHALGPPNARVTIVMFGDFQEPGTAAADAEIRLLLMQHSDVRYVFRHFPVNKDCNPAAPDVRHAFACRAALAAEAAFLTGGENAYWKLHDWLMRNSDKLDEQTLAAALPTLDLDPAVILAAPDSKARAALDDDVAAGRALGINVIPAIYVDSRQVPRWSLEGAEILSKIIAEAAAK
ncbi:MAG: thioredoxin domain-containing protein [Phycisphaerae bacterium]